MKDYEKAQKNLMRLIRVADKARIGAKTLEEKLSMIALVNDLQKALDILRLNKFKYDDAIAFAENTEKCGECGDIHAAR